MTYLVIWASGDAPTAIDAYTDYDEALVNYETLDSIYGKSPTDWINLVIAVNGQVHVLAGPKV